MLYDLHAHRRKDAPLWSEHHVSLPTANDAEQRLMTRNAPAQEPGQDPKRCFRLYESSRTKVTSMFTL